MAPSGGGNFGAAAALRARLLGRSAPPAAAAAAAEAGGAKREVVVLPQVDPSGRAVPGAFGRDKAGAGARVPLQSSPTELESSSCMQTAHRVPEGSS